MTKAMLSTTSLKINLIMLVIAIDATEKKMVKIDSSKYQSNIVEATDNSPLKRISAKAHCSKMVKLYARHMILTSISSISVKAVSSIGWITAKSLSKMSWICVKLV